MTAFISLIFIVGIVLFVISTVVVLFHFFYYRLEKGHHQTIMAVFVAGSLVLLGAEFFVYSQIQWDAINDVINQYLLQRGA